MIRLFCVIHELFWPKQGGILKLTFSPSVVHMPTMTKHVASLSSLLQISNLKQQCNVSGRDRLSSPEQEKKTKQNKERNFSPSVFLRELSHACRKLHRLHCGINSEGLKSPTVRDVLLLDPQNRTVNQCGAAPDWKGPCLQCTRLAYVHT